jgi:hypothetical protein
MVVRLCAHEVPQLMENREFLSLRESENSMRTKAPVARGFKQGETFVTSSKLNRNAAQMDLVGRYGGGGYAVAFGLEIEIGQDGHAIVHAGHAVIDGVVEVSEKTVLKLLPSCERVYVWLRQDGELWCSGDVRSLPGVPACYLGCCKVVDSKAVEADQSGVLYLKGGSLWRETADTGVPSVTPNFGGCHVHVVQGGTLYFDGRRYLEMLPFGSPRWIGSTVRGSDLAEGWAKVANLPKGAVVHGVRVSCLKSFGENARLALALKGSQESIGERFEVSRISDQIRLNLSACLDGELGARVENGLGDGELRIWVLYSVLE